MTPSQAIDQAIQQYLSHVASGADDVRLVTLFAGAPTSVLAQSLVQHAAQLEQYHIEMQVVLAGGPADALRKFADRIGIGRLDGVASIRTTSRRDYDGCNEQLVLGSSSFASGPTIAEVKRNSERS